MVWLRTERLDNAHQCELPAYGYNHYGVKTGDVWQCDTCDALWQVTVDSDQRDQSTWFTWRKL